MDTDTQDSKEASNQNRWWMVYLKGIMMGAVEIIPGVSAGTLALITGILPRLLSALRHFDFHAIKYVLSGEFRSFWQHVDGSFLVVLALGVVSGFALLIQIISYALLHYPIFIWSFFFGLILASSFWLALQINNWKRIDIPVFFLLGIAFAYFITVASPIYIEVNPLNVFFAGLIAISAMMLPGLSGSFILMLAGLYVPILSALKALQMDIILSFMAGAVIGILAFSHLLHFLFNRFPLHVYALLTGVMLGSLNRIWPWQRVLEYRVNSHGEKVPMLSESISPWRFASENSHDPQIMQALFFMILGLLAIVFMSHLSGLLGSESLKQASEESKGE